MNYQKKYNDIIDKAKNKNRLKLKKNNINYIYYELHHIIPKCLEGTNDKENLVLLTAKEHYVCHKLLTYIYPKFRPIIVTLHLMTHTRKEKIIFSSRDYAYIRELINLVPISDLTKQKIIDGNKGKIVSEEAKKKISKSLLGKKFTKERCENISKSLLGRKLSISHIENRNKAQTGIKRHFKKRKCPYCKLIGKGPNMTRYHFNNCKNYLSK